MRKALLLAPMSSVHERFNIANINVLQEMETELHIAANFETDEKAKQYAEALNSRGIRTHHIPFVRSSLKNNLKCIPTLRKLFADEKFDMVHCHTETGGILTRIAMGACKSAKYVYTPHGMSFYKGSSLISQMVYKPLEKWICSGMDANLAMNAEELQVLQKWDPRTAFFIHGIGVVLSDYQNIAVDKEEKRRELGIPKDAFVLLSVGELNQNKNHMTILKALSQLQSSDMFYYLICGEGPLRNELKSEADKFGFKNRLIMPGYRYDMAEIFHIADAFAFPSYHEGLAASMIQAMAVGLPIVCSKIRGNVDLVTDGEGGFLCAPDDVEAFQNSLKELFESIAARENMKAVNLRNVEKYDISNIEMETKNIYRRILSK